MIAARRMRPVRRRAFRASSAPVVAPVVAAAVGVALLVLTGLAGPVAALPAALTPGTSAPPALQAPAGVKLGNDVSWTQCPVSQGGMGNPMPGPDARFAIVQLGMGQAFTTNPCLGDELTFLRAQRLPLAAYVVPTYPTNAQFARYGGTGPYGTRTFVARLYNVGWQEAAYWVAVHRASGLRSPMVWVDVEATKNGPQWSSRTAYNLAVIRGLLAGLARSGVRTGIYTTSIQWRDITGGAQLRLPEWRTVAVDTPAIALGVCARPGHQGGPVVLSQYTASVSSSVDYDLLCPKTATTALATYFTHP